MDLGRPSLFVRGRPVQPVLYSLTDMPGGRWTWEEIPNRNISLFASRGFELFQVDLLLEHLWTAEDAFDIRPARRQIRGILKLCPRAGVVVRLHVNAPGWWNQAHPEECVEFADGPVDAPAPGGLERVLDRDLARAPRHSLASTRWLREAGRRVRELCRCLAATPEGDALAGVHVAGGVFGEWAYFGFIEHDPDTGPAMTSYFRRWLARRYEGDADLCAAWNDPSASIASASVPGVAERERTSDGVFRDPRVERRVIDYFECQHDALVDSLLQFCRIVKRSWPRPLITGVFYGYLFSQFGRQAAGGHLLPQRILSSPYVDYLSSPQTYQPYSRDLGGTGMSRGLLESCTLHGKLWLDEMDQPTHLGCVADPKYSCTLPDAVAILRRNVVHPLLRGHGLWYYDFGPRFSSGWWDDPVLIEEIRRLKEFFDGRMAVPYQSPADVLLVGDTSVFFHTGHRAADPVSEPALDEVASALYRSGVCFHMVGLSDIERVDWSRYRAVVFANTWVLTPRQVEFITTTVARDGRHLVWVYAPGYSDGERLCADRIADVTGMAVERISIRGLPRIVVRAGEAAGASIELKTPVAPLFSPRDGDTLALFEGTDFPGVARSRKPEFTSWFCSLPPTSPALSRTILRESGAHVWSDAGDVLIAGWGLLCVHTLAGGPRTFALPGGARVEVPLPARSTTILDAGTGAVLIGGTA